MSSGVDYAWSRPSPASLKAAGMSFVCRYLATDRLKALSKTEATALAAAGIWLVVVWETTEKRMLAGKAGGVADATSAAAQATACGMPASRPIYFAADWDATEAQQTAINAYLDGAASVVGRDRVGIYGGYYPVRRALNAGKAVWAWQTRAWSGDHWDPRAHIRQGAYVTIGGVQCDANTSMTSDFGQWMPGKTPTPEDPMAISDADARKIAKALIECDGVPAARPPHANGDYDTNKLWRLGYALQTTAENARAAAGSAEEAAAQARANGAALSKLAGQVGAVHLDDTQVPALAAALAGNPTFVTALAAALAENLADRMQS